MRFLRWFLRDELAEEVMGDLEEQFYVLLDTKPPKKARRNYWYQVIFYLRLFALRTPKIVNYIHIPMFKNYLRVAWRNLLRHKLHSAIKIGGFAIGMAACFLIAMYITDELSYNQHYPKKDRLFRLLNKDISPDEVAKWPAFQPPTKQALLNEFPEIEKVARLIPFRWYNAGSNQVRAEGQEENLYEEGFVYADPELLEILDIPMVYGNNALALSKPNTIVLSRSKAEKYFPDEDPVGKTLVLNEDPNTSYEVGGVMEDFPESAHFDFDFILTLTGKEFWPGEQSSWCCSNYEHYVLVKPGTDVDLLEQKLMILLEKYMMPSFKKDYGDTKAQEVAERWSFLLQPIGEIHLYSKDIYDIYQNGDIQVVWMFGAIAAVILLLAIINFVNIATAKSMNRSKEVGLRKVIGSQRYQLIQHFLTESILYSFAAFLLGLSFVNLSLPLFNTISGKNLSFPWAASWWVLPMCLFFVFVLGIVAGIYPALYLSSFQPIEAIRGTLKKGGKGSGVRSALVIFQFTTSVILIVGALIVHRQMNYILTKKLGYDKDQVLIVQGTNTLGNKSAAFKEELLKLAQVQHATYSNYLPVSGTTRDGNEFWKEGKEKIDRGIGAQKWGVDEDYLATLDMKLIEGRNFDKTIASDSTAIIINQTMAKELGLKEPLGARIVNSFQPPFHIIGVIEDFHYESMRGEIRSLALVQDGGGSMVSLKINTDKMGVAVKAVENVWNKFAPKQPIRYSFLDERYAIMYEDVQRTGNIFDSFAVLAILVACIGLFALSSFMAEQRRKEISIRKVLGASSVGLFRLLTFRFLRLIVFSLLLAVPISWFLMKAWLEDYKYRTPIGGDVFLLAGGLILFIALMTISYESYRVIRMNPSENLKAE